MFRTTFQRWILLACGFLGFLAGSVFGGETLPAPEYVASVGEIKIADASPSMGLIANFNAGYVKGLNTEGPVKVYFGYRLTLGKLVVVVEANDTAAQRAEVELKAAAGGKSARGSILEFTGGKGGVVLHDLGLLPEGDSTLEGKLQDAGGKELASFKSVFRRVPLPWLGNKLGLPETPPPPFEPVVVKESKVSVVGREATVAGDGNFESLVILGEEVLAAPIRFVARAGGKSLPLAGASPKFGACTATEARWEGEARGAGVAVLSKVVYEYDGMARYDLVLKPEAGAVDLEGLTLQIPLKAKYARLLNAIPPGGAFRTCLTAFALPERDGALWDTHTWFKTMEGLPERPFGGFASVLWLGGAVRGLCWFAENDRGWAPSPERPALAIERAGETVTLNVNLIAAPFKLAAARAITYGLIATPPKPLPKDHRLWNRGESEKVGVVGGRLTSCDAFAPWEISPAARDVPHPTIKVRDGYFSYWPPLDNWEHARLACEKQHSVHAGKYPKGCALMLYHDKAKCPVHPDVLSYFQWIWRVGSYPQDRVDHLVWYMDRWLASGMDGIYIDDIFPQRDCNGAPVGSAYYSPGDGRDFAFDSGPEAEKEMERLKAEGKEVPKVYGLELFAYREYLKRVYALFCQHGKPPIITTHMTNTMIWPLHSFATVAFDCEDQGRFSTAGTTYMDAWTLERFEIMDNPERTGLVTVPMFKGQYLTKYNDAQKFAALRSAWAMWLLFDHSFAIVGHGGIPAKKLADVAGREYYGTDVEVLLFWRNEAYLTLKAEVPAQLAEEDLPKKWKAKYWSDEQREAVKREPLRATLYKKNGRALLVVANFLKKPIKAEVSVDLERLGVPAAARASFAVEDVDDWKPKDDLPIPPPDRDLAHKANVLTFTVGGQDFRAVELKWKP
ncbi:MAG: DUF6067 family protein [Planctomycetota bacterium]|nr:DUF6067 family protein [Planctomycetota bacterium]